MRQSPSPWHAHSRGIAPAKPWQLHPSRRRQPRRRGFACNHGSRWCLSRMPPIPRSRASPMQPPPCTAMPDRLSSSATRHFSAPMPATPRAGYTHGNPTRREIGFAYPLPAAEACGFVVQACNRRAAHVCGDPPRGLQTEIRLGTARRCGIRDLLQPCPTAPATPAALDCQAADRDDRFGFRR